MVANQSTKRSLSLILAILLLGSRGPSAWPTAECYPSKSSSSSIADRTNNKKSTVRYCAISSAGTTTRTTELIIDEQVDLSNGISMQLMASFPRTKSDTNPTAPNTHTICKPVLLFLHGSFHGAWCWAEHFMPYFTELGYPTVAISWRGTGGTFAGVNVRKVKLLDHVDDLRCLLADALPVFIARHAPSPIENTRPVLICHSFGGLAVMKYLEMYYGGGGGEEPSIIRGVVTMCSVPPSGNGKVTLRYLRRSLVASWKITAGFAFKKCLSDGDLCRTLFFGGPKLATAPSNEDDESTTLLDHGISDEDLRRYQSNFARDSAATIDIMDLSKRLPSRSTNSDGRALFLGDGNALPFLVAGARDDFIVDKGALDETATYFGACVGEEIPILIDSPHDVMLGQKWINAASVLKEWLASTYSSTTKPVQC